MQDEQKPSPDAVLVWREAFTRYNATATMTMADPDKAAALVIDRALRPVPGDMVEAVTVAVGKALKGDAFDPFAEPETFEFAGLIATAAITTMQPALQAAVEALEEARLQLEYLDSRNPTGTTPTTLTRIATALTTLRSVNKEAPKP